MTTKFLSSPALVLVAALSFAQAAPSGQDAAAQAEPVTQIPAGTVIPAELSKSLDAKKAKPGDKVEAKTTMDLLSKGQVVIPRNTKIIGHVTDAKPRTKESSDSMVGIAFDRVSMKGGRELPMQAAIQALGEPLQRVFAGSEPMSESPSGMPPAGGSQQGSTMGGAGRPGASSSTPPPFPTQGAPSEPAPSGATGKVLDPSSQGVVGLEGLSLTSSAQGSVVSSNTDNVHLDSGTQLILRTQ
jgi:hypothetical protein